MERTAYRSVRGSPVVTMTAENADAFLQDRAKPLRIVLFTAKIETPQMWTDLAEQKGLSCAFGIVHHSEAALMARFDLHESMLPHIILFPAPGDTGGLAYNGQLTLDGISAFVVDAVRGGEACVAARREVDAARADAAAAREELREAHRAHQEASDAAARASKAEAAKAEAAVASLQKQLRDACAGAASEVARVRTEEGDKVRQASEALAEVSAALVREREDTQSKIEAAVERQGQARALREAQRAAATVETELRAAERAARAAERALHKAASAVHVATVRNARESERMHAALRDFIDDVAPTTLAAPAPSAGAGAPLLPAGDGDGVLSAVSSQLRKSPWSHWSLKQRLRRDASSDSSAGDGAGARRGQAGGRGKAGAGLDARPGHAGPDWAGQARAMDEHARASRPGSEASSERGRGAPGPGPREDGPLDAAAIHRLKKTQARELANLRGFSDVTVAQLTREVEKTGAKNVFRFRGLTLRLLTTPEGARDRLIDDETGDLVYACAPAPPPPPSY